MLKSLLASIYGLYFGKSFSINGDCYGTTVAFDWVRGNWAGLPAAGNVFAFCSPGKFM